MNHLWMANHTEKKQYELLLKTKLRNRILQIWPQGIYYLKFQLKNVRINGVSRGCTGFIQNSITGNIVYVNTEPFMFTGYLRRYARSMEDYTGLFNNDALSDIREKAKAEGNIYLSKKITMQMIRIELAISYIEDEEEESND